MLAVDGIFIDPFSWMLGDCNFANLMQVAVKNLAKDLCDREKSIMILG